MYISVDVDVDEIISDISTKELIDELKTRDDAPEPHVEPQWNDFYQLLSLNKIDDALQLLRKTVESQTGRILP